MANENQEEKLDGALDETTEISDDQLDGIAGGRWRMHQPTERERRRHAALKRQKAEQTEEPPEHLDY
ncbi:MAG: hypothetical protein Q4B54_11985 [Coriobacteriales bacterium]|nr:hypothetical protein [Coriobacteriales bacterium]